MSLPLSPVAIDRRATRILLAARAGSLPAWVWPLLKLLARWLPIIVSLFAQARRAAMVPPGLAMPTDIDPMIARAARLDSIDEDGAADASDIPETSSRTTPKHP